MNYYHSSKENIKIFEKNKTVDGGFHFGTLNQAKARNNKGYIVEVELDIRKYSRSKDTGGNWKTKIDSAKKRGCNAIIYLNRYEGISTNNLLEVLNKGIDIDKLSDKDFKKYFPESEDSILMFNSEDIKIINSLKLEQKNKKLRM